MSVRRQGPWSMTNQTYIVNGLYLNLSHFSNFRHDQNGQFCGQLTHRLYDERVKRHHISIDNSAKNFVLLMTGVDFSSQRSLLELII